MGTDVCVGAIGSYEILRQLPGQNREIYLAKRQGEASGRFVLAAFELRTEDARWLTEEVERCQRLEHEGLTRIVEAFQQDGKHAVVFEPVRGVALCTLMDHLRKEGERLADRAAHYVGEVLFGALAAAHHQPDDGRRSIPIVHGQLGPHLVFLSWEGEVKLLGLGLSRVYRLAQGIEAVPTEARPFLAPECRAGAAASTRSNVFTGAAMLWALYAHELPTGHEERLAPLRSKRPDLPSELCDAVDQALEPLVVRRGITASELARTFEGRGGAEGRRELRWNVEVLRGGESVEESVPLPNSFPPARLSTAPRPPADPDATPSQRDPAVPAPPPVPSEGLQDEPTAMPPTRPLAVRSSEPPRDGSPVGRGEGGSSVPSDNMPTGSWRVPDREGMQKLLDAAQARAIEEVTTVDAAPPVPGAPPPLPALGVRPAVPRPLKPRGEEPAPGLPPPRAPKPDRGQRGSTLTGIGTLGDEPQAGTLAGAGPRLGRRAVAAELRTTKPSVGAVTRGGAEERSGGARPANWPPAGRVTQPIGAARVVPGASRSSVIGRFGPPALEAVSERAPSSRARDLRAEEPGPDEEPADAALAPPSQGPAGHTRRRSGPRRGRSELLGEQAALAPSRPQVVVVAEAVRPSVRPPRPYDDPALGPGPDRPAPEHPVAESRRPNSMRPRAPRSRGVNMRLAGEAPVSGRLVSVRPAALDGETPLAGAARAPGPTDENVPARPEAEAIAGSPATERAPSPADGASTTSDAPTVLPRSLRVASLVPTRWVVPIAAVIAVTAVVSFSIGLLVGSGPLDVRVANNGADATAKPLPGAPAEGAAATAHHRTDRAEPASSAVPAASASPVANATGQPSAEPPARDGDDGSALPPGFGYLLVRSSAADAHVYVAGTPVGVTGKQLLVRCGLHHVRLGEVPLRSWLSPGKPVSVVCQGVTSVSIEPGKRELAGASPGAGSATPASPRFVPQEL